MTGKELKDKISQQNIPALVIARKLGISPQALNSTFNAADVKSGTIERIAVVLGVKMSFFYPMDGSNAVASGNGIAVAGNDNVAMGDNAAVLNERVKFLEQQIRDKESLLEEKERTIKILMENKQL
jgi:transcriptional regulator with XRE-family HTH domain